MLSSHVIAIVLLYILSGAASKDQASLDMSNAPDENEHRTFYH
jgi:hypothetical protein